MSQRQGLIMSGAVVGQELAAEFGPLPPAFLPVGHQRLYELQAAAISPLEGRWQILVPDGFELRPFDARRLADAGLNVLTSAAGLSLGEALIRALHHMGPEDGPVSILHGDTLIRPLPTGLDVIIGGVRANDYAWAELELADDNQVLALVDVPAGDQGRPTCPLAAGYFAFSTRQAFLSDLEASRGRFIAAVNRYIAARPVHYESAESWLDFGHVQTFFQSRRTATTARSFNTVSIDGITARKSGDDSHKIEAEALWLQTIPSDVQLYCARVINSEIHEDKLYYETEYEYIPTLAELFVYGEVSRRQWLNILESCETFLNICGRHQAIRSGDSALALLTVDKTKDRLEAFARDSGMPIDTPLTFRGRACPSLLMMAEQIAVFLRAAKRRPNCVMHGDFCFSNILFNARQGRIRALDPRGLVGRQPTIFGDGRYDLAKLAHSIVGGYDQIIAGRYALMIDGIDHDLQLEPLNCQPWLAEGLSQMTVQGQSGWDETIAAITIGLFLAMLPLHADHPGRQKAFLANALRLWSQWDRP